MLIFLNNPCGSSVSSSTIAKDDVFFRCMSKRNGATSSGVGNLDRCRGRIERQALVFSCVSRQLFARLQLSFGHFQFVAGVACFVAAIPFAVALHDSCRRRYVEVLS